MTRHGKPPFNGDAAKRAVLKVRRGRGFVMEIKHRIPSAFAVTHRVIVTAAHCLPFLPLAHPWAPVQEKTYEAVLGALCDAQPFAMAECLFVDPVADLAVLGEPDGQAIGNADSRFDELMDGAKALRLGKVSTSTRGWVLSLDGRWTPCTVECSPLSVHLRVDTGLWITEAAERLVGGMSGSPILLNNGRVVGVLSTSVNDGTISRGEKAGPHPRLTHCLPGWLLKLLRTSKK